MSKVPPTLSGPARNWKLDTGTWTPGSGKLVADGSSSIINGGSGSGQLDTTCDTNADLNCETDNCFCQCQPGYKGEWCGEAALCPSLQSTGTVPGPSVSVSGCIMKAGYSGSVIPTTQAPDFYDVSNVQGACVA